MIEKDYENEALHSPVRQIHAAIDVMDLTDPSKYYSFKNTDALKSVSIERIGDEGKFFGYGICQKANIHLIDVNREININSNFIMTPAFAALDPMDFTLPMPIVQPTEINRDENTNELSITAYDFLYTKCDCAIADLNLTAPYTMKDIIKAWFFHVTESEEEDIIQFINVDPSLFDVEYSPNFDGTETMREVFDDIAEATQTIYYITPGSFCYLTFKRLDRDGEAAYTIGKEDYITLQSKTNRRLATIVSATELGDNVSASLEQSGSTQFIRDNAFWDLRDDVGTLVEDALAAMGGLTINQFECDWRGNYLVEIGDKINLVTKDNEVVTSYLLNDTLDYDGSLSQRSSWNYTDNDSETEDNPSTLGDALKQTFAKVDKANKQVEIVVSDVNANTSAITSLEMTTDNITASVTDIDDNMSNLASEVSTKMSANDVSISIQKAMEQGVERVTTSTGFVFNEEGLHISKENSEITTSITEDGMNVYRSGEKVLSADNLGVKAEDLHATTFLIIGENSRFEDYGSGRTGCFWIGK